MESRGGALVRWGGAGTWGLPRSTYPILFLLQTAPPRLPVLPAPRSSSRLPPNRIQPLEQSPCCAFPLLPNLQ